MKELIKIASGEIRFYDGSIDHFSSLEQLLRLVAYHYKSKGLAEIVRIDGVDQEGKSYRLGLDFSNFQVMDEKTDPVLLTKVKRQKFIGELLIESGIITHEQLETALQEQGKLGYKEKIGEVLLRLGYCSAEQILYALAKQIGIHIKTNI